LKAGANINFQTSEGTTPLWRACQLGNVKCVTALLEHDPSNINNLSRWGAVPFSTPLWIAAREGHLSVIELLLKYKANVNIKSQSNRTPLQAAIDSCSELSKDFRKSAQEQKRKIVQVLTFLKNVK